jgi:CheY-like chemotaxis protein
MPDMDGGATASEIKKINPAVPIIMFSALSKLPDDLLHMVEAFVQKGSPIGELISKIEKVLRK